VLWGRSLAKVSTLTFCVVASITLGIIIKAGLESRVERKKHHHFHNLENWYR